MNARIVLFLGSEREAKQTRYVRVGEDGPLPTETYLPWSVLMKDVAEICPDSVTQVVVIGSNETYKDWKSRIEDDAWDAGYKDLAKVPIAFLRYQDDTFTPSNPDVYWRFFDNLRRALGGEPVAGLDGFCVSTHSPEEAFAQPAHHVLMDITRGFRAAPFIGASALAFVRAADRRHGLSLRHRIYYAAYEAKSDDDITPVWDLTPFVDGVELSDALDAFTRHGRADDLARFFEESKAPAAEAIAQPMKQFADDLLLMRIPNLLTESAPALQKTLSESIENLKEAFPPVHEEFDRFKEQIDSLTPSGDKIDPVGQPGLNAVSVLAQRLWDTNRYAELYNLLRESLVTAFSVVAVSGNIEQPGSPRSKNPHFKKQRGKIENKCRSLCPDNPPQPDSAVAFKQPLPKQAQRIAKQFGEVADRRNDVAHCSMHSDPQTQEDLRSALKENLKAFRELVDSLKSIEESP